MADLLLARVPDTLSPALQSLERRLPLSPAATPEGPNEGDRTLPVLRAAALLRLGELNAARAVTAAIPERERGPATDPFALFTAVSGLRQIGLKADARRLAVEAALAAGL